MYQYVEHIELNLFTECYIQAYLLAPKRQLHLQLSSCIYKEGFSFSQADGLICMLMRASVKIYNACNAAGQCLITPSNTCSKENLHI